MPHEGVHHSLSECSAARQSGDIDVLGGKHLDPRRRHNRRRAKRGTDDTAEREIRPAHRDPYSLPGSLSAKITPVDLAKQCQINVGFHGNVGKRRQMQYASTSGGELELLGVTTSDENDRRRRG